MLPYFEREIFNTGDFIQQFFSKLISRGQVNILRWSDFLEIFRTNFKNIGNLWTTFRFIVENSKQVVQTSIYMSREVFTGKLFLKKQVQKKQLGKKIQILAKNSSSLSKQHSTQPED